MVLFNLLILSYFVAGNGVYTALMVMSLKAIWLHSRRVAYQGLTEVRDFRPDARRHHHRAGLERRAHYRGNDSFRAGSRLPQALGDRD